jgi:hypothetical protein
MFDTKKSRTVLVIALIVGIPIAIMLLSIYVPTRDMAARATLEPKTAVWTEQEVRGMFHDMCSRCCSHGHIDGSWQQIILMPDPRGGDDAQGGAAHMLHDIYEFDLGPKV